MALIGIVGPGNLWMPFNSYVHQAAAPSLLDETLDAADEACHMVGRLFLPARTGSKVISAAGSGKIHWMVGASTITFANAGTNIRVGIQDITAGVPMRGDATFDVYADLVGGTDTLTAATAVSTTMESGTKTIAHNDLIAVVFRMTTLGGADTIKVRNCNAASAIHRPSVTFEAAAAFSARTAAPLCAIEFDDGTIGVIRGGWITNTGALSTVNSVGTSSTPDEYGNVIRFPQEQQIDELWAIIGCASASADCELILYSDPFGTPTIMGSAIVVDGGTVQSTSTRTFAGGITTQTLAADTDYLVAVRPTSTTVVLIPQFTVAATPHWNAHPLGPNCHMATRSDNTGAFTATTTARIFAGVGIGGLHDETAGVGGGGAVRIEGHGAYGDIALGQTIDIKFTSHDATGALFALASGTVAAYVGNGTTETTAGVTLTSNFDGRTGLHNVRVVATAANGYAALTDVHLILTAGTVDGVSVGGEVANFSIENRNVAGLIAKGTAQSGDTDGIRLAAATSIPNNAINSAVVYIKRGAGAGQSRLLTAWVSATDDATISPDWVTGQEPDSTSEYEIYTSPPTTTTNPPDVNVISFDPDAITAASIAADAFTAAKFAADVTTELQTGLATAAALTTIDDFIDTEVAAVLAAVDTEIASIKTKTDFLPSATAGAAGGLFIAGANAATSITTALTANLIGNITGNLSGSAGSVTGLTVAAIVNAVLDELLAGHAVAGSAGAALTSGAAAGGDPLSTALPGAYAAGTAGAMINAINAKAASLTFTLAGIIDANVQRVNNEDIDGDGGAANRWRKAGT